VAETSAQHALEQQLQAAREEAELTLEQLHLVQEELEVYFLKAQDLEEQLDKANSATEKANSERDQLKGQIQTLTSERDEVIKQSADNASLLQTAQRMLDGQARYLEDLSLKEERADQAVDELRLLKDEMLYYIQYSKPARAIDPKRVQRLIELTKTPTAVAKAS
jgi:chromosome segregation ATPase